MTGNAWIDILIALIGAFGLIVPGWLTYRGSKLGKDKQPAVEQHGSLEWQLSKTLGAEASRIRDFIAREHDETRRQVREVGFEILRKE